MLHHKAAEHCAVLLLSRSEGIMWLRIFVVGLLFCLNCALAQQRDLISGPSPKLQRPLPHYAWPSAMRTSGQQWYWEADNSAQPSVNSYRQLLHGSKVRAPHFAPVTLEWSFTGKNKFLPVLDLTIVKIKPGTRPSFLSPESEFGSVRCDCGIWTKATRSLHDLLR